MFEGEGYGLCIDASTPYWIIFLSLEGSMSGTTNINGIRFCYTPWSYTKRQAVTVQLNPFLL
jgi:hypothetical protein